MLYSSGFSSEHGGESGGSLIKGQGAGQSAAKSDTTGTADSDKTDGTPVFAKYGATHVFGLSSSLYDVESALVGYQNAITKAMNWMLTNTMEKSTNNLEIAQQLYSLDAARQFVEANDPVFYARISDQMNKLGELLQKRQNSDGGWGRSVGEVSDSMVTAQVGLALDTLSLSSQSSILRKAITWLLSQQAADGSWSSQNRILSTREAATTWVSIWLPTMLNRLGGIDTDLTVRFAPNVAMNHPVPTPDAVSILPSGESQYFWTLKSVTAAGKDVTFDLQLQDMNYGEVRAASTQAFLTFNNAFTQVSEQAPIPIPKVTAIAGVDLGVETDRKIYNANSTVHGTVTLYNTNARATAGHLQVMVEDASGQVLKTYDLGTVSLPANSQSPYLIDWGTGTALAGDYSLHAVLEDGATLLAQGRSDFSVITADRSMTSQLSLDRTNYNANDRVQINSVAINASANSVYSDIALILSVKDAAQKITFTTRIPIAQMAPGVQQRFITPQVLTNASAGVYTVTQELVDAQNTVLDHKEARYSVGSTLFSGFGLHGQIAAQPKSMLVGEAVDITASVLNSGNAVLTDLPVTVYLVDPDQGTVIAQFDQQIASLNKGATETLAPIPWIAQGRVGATYLAILTANVGGNNRTLAQDSFQIVAQAAAGIIATGGTPQIAPAGTVYPVALEATVRDTNNKVVPGVTVTFIAPDSGPSVSFPQGNTAVTDAQGRAKVTVKANGVEGAFTLKASAPQVSSKAVFELQNKPAIAASIQATGGTPQTGGLMQTFNQPLEATVLDTAGKPMARVLVTFHAPAGSPTVTFPAGNTAVTDANGHASIAVKGGTELGALTVTANAPNIEGQATFQLTLEKRCADPDAVRFIPLNHQPYGIAVASNSVTLSGIGSGCTIELNVENGEYKLERAGRILTQSAMKTVETRQSFSQSLRIQSLFNGFTSTPMVVQDGDILTLAQRTSMQPATTTTVRVSMGQTVSQWWVRTRDVSEIPVGNEKTSALLWLLLMLTGIAGIQRQKFLK